MSAARWLLLVLVLAATSAAAHAQVFKPRTGNRAAVPERPAPGSPTPPAAVARAPASPGPVSSSGPASKRTAPPPTAPVAAASKKATRAPGSTGRRAGAASPRKKLRGAGKAHDAERADDDDDVTISDD